MEEERLRDCVWRPATGERRSTKRHLWMFDVCALRPMQHSERIYCVDLWQAMLARFAISRTVAHKPMPHSMWPIHLCMHCQYSVEWVFIVSRFLDHISLCGCVCVHMNTIPNRQYFTDVSIIATYSWAPNWYRCNWRMPYCCRTQLPHMCLTKYVCDERVWTLHMLNIPCHKHTCTSYIWLFEMWWCNCQMMYLACLPNHHVCLLFAIVISLLLLSFLLLLLALLLLLSPLSFVWSRNCVCVCVRCVAVPSFHGLLPLLIFRLANCSLDIRHKLTCVRISKQPHPYKQQQYTAICMQEITVHNK